MIVDVPVMHFLRISGQGDPNTYGSYRVAVEALFSLAYHIKFSIKKGKSGINYGILPLEGIGWAVFKGDDTNQWNWTMMIMQPEPVNHISKNQYKQ